MSDTTPARVTLTDDDEREGLAATVAARLSWASLHWFPTRSRGGIETPTIAPEIAPAIADAVLNSQWLRDHDAAREAAVRAQIKADAAQIERLRITLERRGMTPAALADAVGMPVASLGNLLYLRRRPSTTELLAFAKVLDLDPNWLQHGEATRRAGCEAATPCYTCWHAARVAGGEQA